MKTLITPNKNFLMMLYGYPGCGKSFFSKQFAGEFYNTVNLNSTRLAHELNMNPRDDAQFSKLVDYLVQNYLENGINVILDMPVLRANTRKKYKAMAIKKKVKPVLLWMQMDSESAFIRTKFRAKNSKNKFNSDYTKPEFDAIVNQMQNPSNEEFYVISGKHTYKSQKSAAMNVLANLKIITKEEANKNVPKPELVNLVPQGLSGRGDFRRNISIR